MQPRFARLSNSSLDKKAFLRELAEFANELRQFVEAEVEGFSSKPEDIAARRKAVFDPVTGFEYFVTHYFPHYIVKMLNFSYTS